MPDTTHSTKSATHKTSPKPRLKVEEVVDEPTVNPVSETKVEAEEAKEDTTTETDTKDNQEASKVTSFSMVPDASSSEPEKESETKPDETDTMKSEHAESVSPSTPQDADVSPNEIQEWLQNVRPENSVPSVPEKGGGLGKVLAVFLVLLILGALGGGIYYYQTNVAESTQETETQVEEKKQEVTPTVTVEPTPTTAAVNLTSYKVQILNGSGTSGEAGKAQGYLDSVGFENFTTGNASAFNYAATEVSLKAEVPDEVFNSIQKALSSYYQEVVKSDKALSASSQYDIVVTIGKKK